MKRLITLTLLLISVIYLASCKSTEPTQTISQKEGEKSDSTESGTDESSSGEWENPEEFGPDYIFHNGIILTMDPDQPQVEAIAVENGTILALGENQEILDLGTLITQIIDLDGATLTPGFIDSHSHRLAQRHKWEFTSVEQAAREALSQGWTGVNELAIFDYELADLVDADSRGTLPIRTNVYLNYNSFFGDPAGDWWKSYQPKEQITPNIQIAGIKVFIDFNSGREFFFEQEELNQLFQTLHNDGWQIATKAISIQSHELALTAFEYALNGETNENHRFRIEHSVGVTDEQMAQMAALGIITAIQPGLPGVMSYDPDIYQMAEENGYDNVFRWSDYQQSGVIMAASPLNPPQAFEEQLDASHMSPTGVMYRALTQIGPENQAPEPWMLEKVLTVEQLLPLLTINGAYSTGEEDIRGSLVPGKLADMVILSNNPLTVPTVGLLDITAQMTMVGGEIVYCREGSENLCGLELFPAPDTEADDTSNNEVIIPTGASIKIAVQGPVSGGASQLYPSLYNTVQMVIDDYGSILDQFPVELIEVDDQCDEGQAQVSATKLVYDHPNVLGVIGPLCSSGALGALPIYQESNLSTISGSATREDLAQRFGKSGFNRTILHEGQLNELGLTEDYIEQLEPVQDFYARYESLYGPIPSETRSYLPYTYDAAQLLLSAIEEGIMLDPSGNSIVNRTNLADAIRFLEFEGLTGRIVLDEIGNRIPIID